MKTEPNAQIESDGETRYERAGGRLKLKYEATREEGKSWIHFDPSSLQIELDGLKIEYCQSVSIRIEKGGIPTAVLSLNLDSIDIDANTLLVLETYLKDQQGKL